MTILLVRLRLIGDVVFTTPVIRALACRFPDARLVYVVETAASPVVKSNPHLSKVITISHQRGWRRMVDDVRLARDIRAEKCDIAIDFHGGPRSAWLTWASSAPVRVGYDVAGRSWMYTRVVHRPRILRPRHSVENQWDLLAAVDAAFTAPPDPEHDRVEMPVTSETASAATRHLVARGIPQDARLVVLHVSAGNPFRRWPLSAFADVAARLVTAPNRWVLVTSGPSEHEAARQVVDHARRLAPAAATRIVDDGGCSLEELRGIFDRSALFIGGDSGPLHIASTSNVPIVGLYGPTLAERSAPWRPRSIPTVSVDAGALPCRPCEQRVCAPGDFRCLTNVSADAVGAAAERLLGATA